MADIYDVIWGRRVKKQLERAPPQIGRKFFAWVVAVRLAGLRDVRKNPGFHDEPLRGQRAGQRSIRLNRGWRAIYVERQSGAVELVEVIEVNHHEY
jgi:proteic killer suppression protein